MTPQPPHWPELGVEFTLACSVEATLLGLMALWPRYLCELRLGLDDAQRWEDYCHVESARCGVARRWIRRTDGKLGSFMGMPVVVHDARPDQSFAAAAGGRYFREKQK